MVGLRLKFGALLMQVDFLITELQRLAPACKAGDLHSQHRRIEFAAALDIGDRQYQMVKSFNLYGFNSPQLAVINIEPPRRKGRRVLLNNSWRPLRLGGLGCSLD